MNAFPNPLRVILVDDHTLVRAGIRALVERLPNVSVIAECSNGRELLQLLANHQVDLVLMDISMPVLNGLEATTRVMKEFPQVRVIILSMHLGEEYVWQSLKAGAVGYLLKKSATAELENALKRVMEGEVYLSKEISSRLIEKLPLQRNAELKNPYEHLTERQREVLQLIAEGQNTKEIADLLNVSPKTVEYHRSKLMEDLNVHDIPGLVRLALRMGLISLEC